MKAVFFDGDPWLLLCKNAVYNASAVDLLNSLPSDVPLSVGTIDNCSKPLSVSGRSIYQRFHLTPYTELILSYHAEPPEPLYFAAFSSLSALVTHLQKHLAWPLFNITSTSQLQRLVRRPFGAVLMICPREVRDDYSSLISNLIARFPTLKFGYVDVDKYRISFESRLRPQPSLPHLIVFKPQSRNHDTKSNASSASSGDSAAEKDASDNSSATVNASNSYVLRRVPVTFQCVFSRLGRD